MENNDNARAAHPFGPKTGVHVDPESGNEYKIKVPTIWDEAAITNRAIGILRDNAAAAAVMVSGIWTSPHAWALMAIVERLTVEAPPPIMNQGTDGKYYFNPQVFDDAEMGEELRRLHLAILQLRASFRNPATRPVAAVPVR